MTKKLPVAMNDEEFESLIKHTKKPHHRLAFLLGYGAGMRVSEVVNLTPDKTQTFINKVYLLR